MLVKTVSWQGPWHALGEVLQASSLQEGVFPESCSEESLQWNPRSGVRACKVCLERNAPATVCLGTQKELSVGRDGGGVGVVGGVRMLEHWNGFPFQYVIKNISNVKSQTQKILVCWKCDVLDIFYGKLLAQLVH